MNTLVQKQINAKIDLLPTYHKLAFGVMVAERYLPNYFAFYLKEQWGNPMILLNGIDLLKHIIRHENYDRDEVELIDSFIEEVTPDMDDFPSNILASFALDVSSMLYDCFEFVKTKDSKNIHSCSGISFESLEMYIQKRDKLRHDLSVPELDLYFSKDELIISEQDFQLNLLDELLSDEKISHKLYIEKTIKTPNIRLYLHQ